MLEIQFTSIEYPVISQFLADYIWMIHIHIHIVLEF